MTQNIWSERHDRGIEMHDIVDVQDEITLAVVDQTERSAGLKHATNNIQAPEMCLKGRFHVSRRTVDCTVFASSSSPLLRPRLRRNSSLLPDLNSGDHYITPSVDRL